MRALKFALCATVLCGLSSVATADSKKWNVEVKNNSTGAGTFSISISVNGREELSKDIPIAGNRTEIQAANDIDNALKNCTDFTRNYRSTSPGDDLRIASKCNREFDLTITESVPGQSYCVTELLPTVGVPVLPTPLFLLLIGLMGFGFTRFGPKRKRLFASL